MGIEQEQAAAYVAALKDDPCAYCGGQATTVDHVVPRSRGGSDTWDNLTGACNRCNASKGARTLIGHLLRERTTADYPAVETEIEWRLFVAKGNVLNAEGHLDHERDRAQRIRRTMDRYAVVVAQVGL